MLRSRSVHNPRRRPPLARTTPLRASLLLVVGSAWALSCSPGGPILRGQYGVTVPIYGAPHELVHTGALSVGALQAVSGSGWGGAADLRFHLGGPVSSGTIGGSLFHTYASSSPRAPFLISEVGFGFGLSSRHDVDGSLAFDAFDPHAAVHMGVPIAGGFTISLGVEIQYVWAAMCNFECSDAVLLTALVGVGFFDPNTAPEDHALSFLGGI